MAGKYEELKKAVEMKTSEGNEEELRTMLTKIDEKFEEERKNRKEGFTQILSGRRERERRNVRRWRRAQR